MLLGAGVFQIAGIQSAKRMGYEVIAIDSNPDAPGLPLADHYEIVSTTDSDAALEIAARYGVQGVMTMSTDTCVPAVSLIAEKLGLVGIGVETAVRATNKLCMRQCFEAAGVPSPRFKGVSTFEQARVALDEIGLPAMLKVPDSSGSRGASKIEHVSQLQAGFRYATESTKADFVLIEEFMAGTEVGGEAFYYDGDLLICLVTNKAITPPPHYVPLGHSLPSRFGKDVQLEIQKAVYDGIRALGIESGPVNFDVMVTEDDCRIIELGARIGGTCLPSIVRYHSGIDTVEAAILVAMGKDPSMLFHATKNTPVAVRLITSSEGGVLVKGQFPKDIDESPDILEYTLDVAEGTYVQPFTCGANRFGHVICQGRDWREAEANANKVINGMLLFIKDVERER